MGTRGCQTVKSWCSLGGSFPLWLSKLLRETRRSSEWWRRNVTLHLNMLFNSPKMYIYDQIIPSIYRSKAYGNTIQVLWLTTWIQSRKPKERGQRKSIVTNIHSQYQALLDDLARLASTHSGWGHGGKKTMALTGKYSPTDCTWTRDNKHSPSKA